MSQSGHPPSCQALHFPVISRPSERRKRHLFQSGTPCGDTLR